MHGFGFHVQINSILSFVEGVLFYVIALGKAAGI